MYRALVEKVRVVFFKDAFEPDFRSEAEPTQLSVTVSMRLMLERIVSDAPISGPLGSPLLVTMLEFLLGR